MKRIEKPPHITSRLIEEASRLLSNNDFPVVLANINEEYLYWDKIKYKTYPGIKDPALLWAAVKLSRRLQYRSVTLAGNQFFFVLTGRIMKYITEFDSLHRITALSNEFGLKNKDNAATVLSSLMDEAIASSIIEGAATSRKQARELLRKDATPVNKAEQMVINNYRTIRYIAENSQTPLTRKELMEIHRLITTNILPETEAGIYRNDDEIKVVDVTDGTVLYTPPPPAKIQGMMKKFIEFYNEKTSDIHPLIKACLIHYFIGYIHPFTDGNGRTARALFYRFLLSRGYYLAEYISISEVILQSRIQYASSFVYSEYDENDTTYFLQYSLKTIMRAYERAIEFIRKRDNEHNAVISEFSIDNLNKRQLEIITMLKKNPGSLLTVKEIQRTFGTSNQTARNDLTGLLDKGFVTEYRPDKKTICFKASYLLTAKNKQGKK